MVAADSPNNAAGPVDMSTRPGKGAVNKAFLKPADPNMLGLDRNERRMTNLFVDYKHWTGSEALGISPKKGKMSYSVPSKASKRRDSADLAGDGTDKKAKSKNDKFLGTWTHGFRKAKDDIFMTIWYRKFLRTKHNVQLEPLNLNK